MKYKKHPKRKLRHLVSTPFIYGMVIPSIFLDITMEIYHHIGFPLYGIPLIERKKYIRIDRQKLSKLNPREKLNCMYCGYINGLFAYAVAVAGATEAYWCGIKHDETQECKLVEPKHHKDFVKYEDMK